MGRWPDETEDVRFWKKVSGIADPDGCWLWTAGTFCKGYGSFRLSEGRTIQAHRWVMGEPDAHVMHRCDTPPCVNPSHLFLGTNADNVADKVAKGRQLKGEEVKLAKLSACDVRRIRADYANGKTYVSLAEEYEVHHSTIGNIIKRVTWKHVRI